MRTAVVTLSVGRPGAAMLDVSRPALRAYARRIGATFHEFRVPKSPYPCGEKFRVRPVVEHYDRTIYLDADVLFDPDTLPDLFDVVPLGHVAAHDDLPLLHKQHSSIEWVQKETDEVTDSQGVPRIKATRCYNSGVLVMDRGHAGFFDPPAKPFPKYHCSEQWWEWRNVVEYGYKTFILPPEWNWQWWFLKRMPTVEERPDIHIRHWAGMGNMVSQDARVAEMKRFRFGDRRGRRCLHLARREEHRHGCNAWTCRHSCSKGLPAVPGAYCQTCPEWSDDGAF